MTVGAFFVLGNGLGGNVGLTVRKLLSYLMLPSARNRTGIYFFHDLVSEPVVALEILTMEPRESRLLVRKLFE